METDPFALRGRRDEEEEAVLLDGIGDTLLVREWTRENVRFLTEGGTGHGEAYGALRALSAVCAGRGAAAGRRGGRGGRGPRRRRAGGAGHDRLMWVGTRGPTTRLRVTGSRC
ncbi:hypothetical protein GCM10018987_54020 [Streptomyces cremeus]